MSYKDPERSRAWRIANPDKIRVAQRRWSIANREKIRAKNRRWYATNRERILETRGQRHSAYREKILADNRQRRKHYRVANLEKLRKRERQRSLRQSLATLGLSLTDYERLTKNGCAICGDPPGKYSKTVLCRDHNHLTGEFRGFLCPRCNVVLGSMTDDIVLFRRAATYLEVPPARMLRKTLGDPT